MAIIIASRQDKIIQWASYVYQERSIKWKDKYYSGKLYSSKTNFYQNFK